MITSSTASRIASVIALKSSISYDGTPSGVRAWMWIMEAPSSTTRRASSAYSSGVYGIEGHWSRFATAPEMEFVMTTGSLKDMWLQGTGGRAQGAGARFDSPLLYRVWQVSSEGWCRTAKLSHSRTSCTARSQGGR